MSAFCTIELTTFCMSSGVVGCVLAVMISLIDDDSDALRCCCDVIGSDDADDDVLDAAAASLLCDVRVF